MEERAQEENHTYYTYRITSMDSAKYYYGVSHVKIENATVEDCLKDGYFGSGGSNKDNKFKRWKAKHKSTMTKEILSRHTTKEAAFDEEKRLIGALWKTDPLCLNSCSGGRDGGLGFHLSRITVQECFFHGEVKHQGNTCRTCINQGAVNLQRCVFHGMTKHIGNFCFRCRPMGLNARNCEVHGETNHSKNGNCLRCAGCNRVSLERCPKHGERKFLDGKCMRCEKANAMERRKCGKHGITWHQGKTCCKCAVEGSVVELFCLKHGAVPHYKSGKCRRCAQESVVTVKACPKHGVVKHKKDKCYSCENERVAKRSKR